MKKYSSQIIISIVFFVLALFFNGYVPVSDGRVYYQVLERIILGKLMVCSVNPVININGEYHQFGVVLFWLPFYLIALILNKTLVLFSQFSSIHNGYEVIYPIFINLADNFYTLFTLFLSLKILRLSNFKVNNLFLIFSVFLSTPILIYSTALSSLNHAVDTFILTLFVYLFLLSIQKKPSNQFLIGALMALSVCVRYLNIGIVIFTLLYYIFCKKWSYGKMFLLGFCSLIWLLPYMHYFVNGSFFRPFSIVLGKGTISSGSLYLLPRHSLKLLLHPIHGLFVWSPISILSCCGLIYYFKENRNIAIFFVGIFLSLVFLQGYFFNWHAGWSFSQRYLTGLFPVYIFGFAYFVQRFPRSGYILGTLFTIYTLFLLANWGTVIHGEFGTPIDMIQSWSSNNNNVAFIVERFLRFLPIHNLT